MVFAPVLLEDWLRDYYFTTEIDLGCSGVEDYSMAEVRALTGLTQEDLDRVIFHDSRSLGGPELRQALADRFAGGQAERVMATHGSSEAIYLTLHTLLQPGDRVVMLDPCYPQFYGAAEAIGCEVVRWPVRFERGFAADLAELDGLVTPQTRMVVVNFPHNPTGTTITREEQQALIAAVAKVGAYLVWDGAFAEITHGAGQLPDPGLFYGRTVSLGTLSKCYGLPGLRVGWCLAAPEILQRFVTTRDYLTLALSPLVELIARRVIENGAALVSVRRRQARRNLDILAAWIEEHADLVEWVRPRGGVSTFVRFPGIDDVEGFCHALVRHQGVLLVPGACFQHPWFARLGFGCSTPVLKEGLARLARELAAARSGRGRLC
ncbi:MAG TPA: capreomycidine synthase [Thermoanaerobaculia bacterium]|nr:capreomycidine synthase [Thermoanaerobaculia bacterium]